MTDASDPATPPTFPLAGRSVRRVGYGAMQLGQAAVEEGPDRSQAADILRRAVELGVDHIDTAHFYADGAVNRLIHEALHPYAPELVLVTKVGAEHPEGGALRPSQRPEQLRAAVEANLRQLGTDRVDVVNLRRMDAKPGVIARGDDLVDLDSQLAELGALREAGTIGGIGLSNVSLEQLRAALPIGLACVQNVYSVLDRDGEAILELCRQEGIAWVPFFPLGSAFPGRPKVTEQPEVLAIASRAGATPAQIGLAWLLHRAPNVLLIPGTSSREHLQENLAAADLALDPEALATLDGLAPLPA